MNKNGRSNGVKVSINSVDHTFVFHGPPEAEAFMRNVNAFLTGESELSCPDFENPVANAIIAALVIKLTVERTMRLGPAKLRKKLLAVGKQKKAHLRALAIEQRLRELMPNGHGITANVRQCVKENLGKRATVFAIATKCGLTGRSNNCR